MKKKILISAGEPSGDLHASNLLRELSALRPDLEFHGIGCEKMESSGVKLFERMDKHSIIGLWEVFEKLGFIRSLFSRFKKFISENKVELAILVDYPGFNLALAKILSAKGIPVVYYITPQVWAWGGWRVKDIKKHVRKSLVIFDFE
jgi:lipid-A-disaccharide synthase